MSEKWVKERNDCTTFKMFSALQHGVERDVKTRNDQLLQDEDDPGFEVDSEPGDPESFWVIQHSPPRRITFRCDERRIFISGGEGPLEATVTLCDDGACRFLVGGERLDGWQLRKRALEVLFGFR